jgi:hypothetical protein
MGEKLLYIGFIFNNIQYLGVKCKIFFRKMKQRLAVKEERRPRGSDRWFFEEG